MREFHVLKHALMHLPFSLLKCHHCEYESKFIPSMAMHLDRDHNVSADFDSNYIDTTDQHIPEIIEVVERCFGKPASDCG